MTNLYIWFLQPLFMERNRYIVLRKYSEIKRKICVVINTSLSSMSWKSSSFMTPHQWFTIELLPWHLSAREHDILYLNIFWLISLQCLNVLKLPLVVFSCLELEVISEIIAEMRYYLNIWFSLIMQSSKILIYKQIFFQFLNFNLVFVL